MLVVAADDGIMPQTVEAINHAKAAGTTIIVAINKMDKPTANPDQVMQQLTEYELVPEEWGGDTICVPVSAADRARASTTCWKCINLVAEVKELKANPNRRAKGAVIEARLDKGQRPRGHRSWCRTARCIRATWSSRVPPWAVCASCATTRAPASRRPAPPCRWRSPA